MPVKRSLAAAIAVAVIPIWLGTAPAQGQTPPGTGCGVVLYPDGTLFVGGAKLTWGARHGTARVHSTVSVSPPTWGGSGATVYYWWKVGTTYVASGHPYYTIPWAANGKQLSAKVLIHMPCGDSFTKYYNFGVVRPPA